jgi:DNA transposition AAA+ family ATPase
MPSDLPPSPEDRARWEEERLPLVERLMAHKASQRATWEALGRETGIAHQTLQLWATGKYAGRIDRVSADVARFFEAQEARQSMAAHAITEPGFVMTPTAEAFQAEMRKAQWLPTIVTLVGNPGIGKTRAAEDYAERNPNVTMVTCLAGHPSGRWLLEELARTLRLTERGGSQRLASVLIDRLRGRNALLIVDEANHLASPTLDLLRGIHDAARCGIALVGNARVVSRLEGARDAEFAQLFRRIGGRLNRTKPTKADVERILSAWGVEDEAAAGLLRATAARPGALGSMTMTLRMAHMLAATKGEPLGAAHIVAADAQLRDQAA